MMNVSNKVTTQKRVSFKMTVPVGCSFIITCQNFASHSITNGLKSTLVPSALKYREVV